MDFFVTLLSCTAGQLRPGLLTSGLMTGSIVAIVIAGQTAEQ